MEREQREEQDLRSQIRDEGVDSHLERDVEDGVHAVLASRLNAGDTGIALEQLSCGSTLCEAAFTLESASSYAPMMQEMSEIGARPRGRMRRVIGEDGSITATYFGMTENFVEPS